jgi:hypothetical protein
MGFSPPAMPKAFFAYALGSKSVRGANLVPVGSIYRNRDSMYSEMRPSKV